MRGSTVVYMHIQCMYPEQPCYIPLVMIQCQSYMVDSVLNVFAIMNLCLLCVRVADCTMYQTVN